MSGRLAALVIAALVGLVLLGLFQLYRRRAAKALDRLDIEELGLELMAGCCAFVVFTTPACRPCKAALRVVETAAEKRPGLTEVTTVDAMDRSDLALRYDVRAIPTVFLITASGHVIERWRKVPHPAEVDTALAAM
ncbi:MAG: thioredoxin family protein [Actinomycetota bacterium]